MATIKLKPPGPTGKTGPAGSRPARAPVRGAGAGVQARPTLAQAQAQRDEREARYQEQLRQRFGAQPPASFQRPPQSGPAPRPGPAFAARPAPRSGRDRPPERHGRPPHGPMGSNQRNDPRNDTRIDNRIDSRIDPRSTPRFDPREARRSDPRPAPAFEPRRDPRDPPRFDPRRDPRASPPSADPRQPPRVDARPAPGGPDPRHAPPRAEPQHAPRGARRTFQDQDDRDDAYDEPAPHAPGSLRLSKRMSQLGIASRREADEWIAKGWVRVDDQVVKELGSRVVPGQRVTVDAKAKFQQAQRVTVLINKPMGYVSGQAEDGHEPAFVLVTPDNLWQEDHSGTRFLREHLKSLVPAGRLDIDSVGLLVLTQDGRIAKQLIGEDSEIEKEYRVRVEASRGLPRAFTPEAARALLCHGLELDGDALLPAVVEWIGPNQLRFVLRQGKKRQIRRMCEAVGLQVTGLKRLRIGNVTLGDLPLGQWRYLRADESFTEPPAPTEPAPGPGPGPGPAPAPAA